MPDSRLRPGASFAFSKRTAEEDAVAKIVALLDDIDPRWREFVVVWGAPPESGGLDGLNPGQLGCVSRR